MGTVDASTKSARYSMFPQPFRLIFLRYRRYGLSVSHPLQFTPTRMGSRIPVIWGFLGKCTLSQSLKTIIYVTDLVMIQDILFSLPSVRVDVRLPPRPGLR